MAERRDGGVRSIQAKEVRYPGTDLPPVDPAATGPQQPTEPGRLAPALDTGIAVDSRTDRRERLAARRRRAIVVGIAVAFGVLLLGGMGWRWASDRTVAASHGAFEAEDTAAAASRTTSDAGASSGAAATVVKAAKATAAIGPTPIFARRGTIMLHLPVPVAKLTEIGFHQASYPYALPMRTPLKDADLTLAHKNRATGRVASKQPTGNHFMTGEVIRMWRARPGKPDTAADVGAAPGTTILSPVTGRVVNIKPYLLYGRYPDYEIHIAPEGTEGIDVVMIHVKDITVHVGMQVVGGVTRVGEIRKFSDKFHDQLAEYTKNGGDHVHVQVNDSDYPGYKGLKPAAGSSKADSASGD